MDSRTVTSSPSLFLVTLQQTTITVRHLQHHWPCDIGDLWWPTQSMKYCYETSTKCYAGTTNRPCYSPLTIHFCYLINLHIWQRWYTDCPPIIQS